MTGPTPAAVPSPLRSCFGFEVRSRWPFHYLREGQGDRLEVVGVPPPDPAAIGTLLAEWLPRPGRPFYGKLYVAGAGYQLWIENLGWFVIHPQDAWIGAPEGVDEVRREEHLWAVPAALCLLQRGDLPIHAAAVEVEGGAVLLAAPGRFGKTTLAAAFLQHGYRVLSEDLSCLRLTPAPVIIPGPAMLRVRRDVLEQFRPRDATVVGVYGERTSLAVDGPRRGNCAPVPLRAVVLLREGAAIQLDPIRPADALRELWALSTRIPTEENRRRCFGMLGSIAASSPTWWLSRPLRVDDLPVVIETIRQGC